MRKIQRTALIAANPERVFALINDIERYPEFVPGCSGATLVSSAAQSLVARLEVYRGMLRTAFTTRNTFETDRRIRMDLVEGPFKSLSGVWTLEPVSQAGSDQILGCKVTLDLSFEFNSKLANLTIGPVIEQVAESLVGAFVARARTHP
jgi:ribosome-associated toxin RatA of RatAB toxin-antitoxin module